MKTWIGYATKHGTTESVVRELSKKLPEEVVLCDLKRTGDDGGWRDADCIILGGPLYAGRLPGALRRFLKGHEDELRMRAGNGQVGLFLLGMQPLEQTGALFDSVFGNALASVSQTAFLGGAFNLDAMNWLERAIVRKVSGATESRKCVRTEEIARFAAAMGASHA